MDLIAHLVQNILDLIFRQNYSLNGNIAGGTALPTTALSANCILPLGMILLTKPYNKYADSAKTSNLSLWNVHQPQLHPCAHSTSRSIQNRIQYCQCTSQTDPVWDLAYFDPLNHLFTYSRQQLISHPVIARRLLALTDICWWWTVSFSLRLFSPSLGISQGFVGTGVTQIGQNWTTQNYMKCNANGYELRMTRPSSTFIFRQWSDGNLGYTPQDIKVLCMQKQTREWIYSIFFPFLLQFIHLQPALRSIMSSETPSMSHATRPQKCPRSLARLERDSP